MKKFIIIFTLLFIFFLLFSQDQTSDYNNTKYLPRVIKSSLFEKDILNNITNEEDRDYILKFYYRVLNKYYFLKSKHTKAELLKLYNIIYSYKTSHGIIALEKAKIIHENEHPVFSQKGGMLRAMDHSFYFRTDDEWTGFSTIFLGYRFGVTDFFNIALEGGVGLPQVYIVSIQMHFKIYETPNKIFFIGIRGRIGYKFQNAESFMFSYDKNTGESLGYLGLGKDYLTIHNRHSLYFATDITLAFRLGRSKAQCIYYTIFPKIDINLQGGQPYFLLCPVMLGYEVRFGQKMEWSFAVEAGYTIPVPWKNVPDGEWINFPSLANVSVNYRFGDKFYWKKNKDKIYNEAMEEKTEKQD